MRRLLAVAVIFLAAAPVASAGVLLGVYGNEAHFRSATQQRSDIQMLFVSFGPQRWLQQRLASYTPTPMLALVPGSYGSPETATPRGIATGANDDFLFQINAIVAAWPGNRFYLRPFPEMNGYWETECAYKQDGSPRDANHSTAWTRKAFARIAVIVRGGTRARIDAQLARLGLPGIDRDLPVTTPKLRMVWNPQGFGAPDVPGNSAQAYYPGDAYVDIAGDDLYDIGGKAEWAAPRRCTTRTRASRSRSLSGACGASTTRSSCAIWPAGCTRTRGRSSSRTTAAAPARSGTSRRSQSPARPTAS